MNSLFSTKQPNVRNKTKNSFTDTRGVLKIKNRTEAVTLWKRMHLTLPDYNINETSESGNLSIGNCYSMLYNVSN